VLKDWKIAGYNFDPVWLEAQPEFHFPEDGRVEYHSVSFLLR
jgi:uncharacterized protein (DUF2126 family)